MYTVPVFCFLKNKKRVVVEGGGGVRQTRRGSGQNRVLCRALFYMNTTQWARPMPNSDFGALAETAGPGDNSGPSEREL